MLNRFLTLVFVTIFLFGCGYKPTSQLIREEVGDSIYANVEIDLIDPENSVLLQDALNQAVLAKFKTKLVAKEKATSFIDIKLNSVSFIPIRYNRDGYVIFYRTKVFLHIKFINREQKRKSLLLSGEYDFEMEPNSIISESRRFESIKFASLKALEQFISLVAIEGLKKDE